MTEKMIANRIKKLQAIEAQREEWVTKEKAATLSRLSFWVPLPLVALPFGD